MASKIVIRTMLVAALVVTAHTIKPFSFGNVTLHALGAARSISFVLPEAAADRIEHAHYLAQTYGKGLFDDDAVSIWAKQNSFRSGLVAFANSVELSNSIDPNADAEIKDVKSSDPSRKPAQKRPVKRIKRDENREEDSGCSKTNEIAQLPDVPMIKAVAMLQPTTIALAYQPKEMNLAMAALIHHSRRLPNLPNFKVEWTLISKPVTLTSLCREASATKTEVVEAPVDIVIGPEEEEDFAELEQQVAPPAPTVAMPPALECVRIP